MNIHLVSDEKFINSSFETFEHYYPGENIFFVRVPRGFKGELNYVNQSDKIIPLCFSSRDAVYRILDYCDSQSLNLFIHYLEPLKAYVALELKKHIELNLYWIAYGADLYDLLYKNNEYQLYDYSISTNKEFFKKTIDFFKSWTLKFLFKNFDPRSISEQFISEADFFCFWNYYDYKLLKSLYTSKIQFKYFRYFDSPVHIGSEVSLKKKAGHILVNHSASKFGNHLTILKILSRIDLSKDLKKVITPLSYGSEEVKKMTIDYGEKHLGYCFKPIVEFLPKEEYFKSLNDISTALFGHRRQQGGGTIHYLLAAGVKIFLRKENNLLKHYRDKGYIVYEIEADLNEISDLEQLDEDYQENNRKLIRKEFSKEERDKCYRSLI